MAVPQEEIQKQHEQAAAGQEGPGGGGPYRGFDPFMQYLLHRLDGMEASINARVERVESSLRGEIKQVETKLDAKIDSLHQELHSTTRWVIGTVIAAVGAAVAVIQWLK